MLAFSEEHEQIRKIVRAWTSKKLEPKVDALEEGEPPYELMRDFAKTFGIADIARTMFAKLEARGDAPPTKGALSARDPSLSAIVSIELSRVCPGFALAFGASAGLAGMALMGKGTLDQQKRKIIYDEIQQIVAQDLPYINLWYLDNVLVHTNRVYGIELNPAGNYEFLRTAALVP